MHERALLEQLDLLAYSKGQTLEIEVLQRLFHRKLGGLDQANNLVGPADIAFYLGRLMEILLVAEPSIREPLNRA